MGSVLVVGVSTQIGLEVIRSLGKRGISVYGMDPSKNAIGFYSRYLKKKFVVPFNPEKVFHKSVMEVLKTHPEIEAVLPISERNITVLNKIRNDLKKRVKPLFPSPHIMNYALNKKKTYEAAKRAKVKVPEAVFLNSIKDVEKTKSMSYPLVLKPFLREFDSLSGDLHDFRVMYVSSYEDLLKKLKDFKGSRHLLMVQQACRGEEVGFAVIMKKGEPVVCFQYLNYHLSPIKGGVPVLRKSIPISHEIKSGSLKLLKEIGWSGVAELDWIRDHRDMKFKLLEINGRFWGGTPLPDRAGLSFPFLLFKALVEDKYFYTESYKKDVRCCLLGGEIRRTFEMLMSNTMETKDSKLRGLFSFISLFFNPKTRFDIQTFDDPLPGIMDVWFMFKKALGFLW